MGETDDVRRILVVANRSIKGEGALAEFVTDRLSKGPCEFHVLVPISASVAPLVALGAAADVAPTTSFDLQTERDAAQERLDGAIAWCAERGVAATGELTAAADIDTVTARLVEARGFDEVIVSTLHSAVSRWLRQDLPRRIERKVSVPVTVVSPS